MFDNDDLLIPIDENVSVIAPFIMALLCIKYDIDTITEEIIPEVVKECYDIQLTRKEINIKCYQKYWEMLKEGN